MGLRVVSLGKMPCCKREVRQGEAAVSLDEEATVVCSFCGHVYVPAGTARQIYYWYPQRRGGAAAPERTEPDE